MASFAMSLRAYPACAKLQRQCTCRLLPAAPQQHNNRHGKPQVLARTVPTAAMPAVSTGTAAPSTAVESNIVPWHPWVPHTMPVQTALPFIDPQALDLEETWIYGTHPYADLDKIDTQPSRSLPTANTATFKRKWPCGMKRFKSPYFITTTRHKPHHLKTQPTILKGLYFHYNQPSPTRIIQLQRADDPTGALREVSISVELVRGSAEFREEMRNVWVANNSWLADNRWWNGISSYDEDEEEEEQWGDEVQPTNVSQDLEVRFAITCPTEPGQRLFITGNVPSLGGWNLAQALKLKWSPGHVWRGSIKLPSGFRDLVEFKAVLKNEANSSWVWQQGPNRTCNVLPSMSAVELVFQ